MKKTNVSVQTNKSYGYFSNLLFNIKSARKWDPKLCYFQFLPVVPGVLASYLGILIPAELVNSFLWKVSMLTTIASQEVRMIGG